MQKIIACFLLMVPVGCGTTNNNYFVYTVPLSENDQSTTTQTTQDDSLIDTAPEVDVVPAVDWRITCLPRDQFSDALFASDHSTDGLGFWFEVDPKQLAEMYKNWASGWGGDYYVYDIDGLSDATFANLYIFDQFGICYDFGVIELALTGQSTGCEWGVEGCIAPLRIHTNEFEAEKTLGAEEKKHLALHPGTVSYIASEPTTLEILEKMGEPVPKTSLVWVGSNVYGSDIWIPYNLLEKYDTDWSADHADQLYGGFSFGLWEGYSQLNDYLSSECEFSQDECDDIYEEDLADNLNAIGYTETFVADSESYIDHIAVQRQLCESTLLWIGDDVFHNGNNVVKGGQGNRQARYLHYSTDLSVGARGWYTYTQLFGYDYYSSMCVFGEDCRESVFNNCDTVFEEYKKVDPRAVVLDFCSRLKKQGMMRDGDKEECARLEDWHSRRIEEFGWETACYRDQYAPTDDDIGDTGFETGLDSAGGAGAKGGGWEEKKYFYCPYLFDD